MTNNFLMLPLLAFGVAMAFWGHKLRGSFPLFNPFCAGLMIGYGTGLTTMDPVNMMIGAALGGLLGLLLGQKSEKLASGLEFFACGFGVLLVLMTPAITTFLLSAKEPGTAAEKPPFIAAAAIGAIVGAFCLLLNRNATSRRLLIADSVLGGMICGTAVSLVGILVAPVVTLAGILVQVKITSLPKDAAAAGGAAPVSVCSQCGGPLRPGVKFCPKCGSPVETAAPTVAPCPPQGLKTGVYNKIMLLVLLWPSVVYWMDIFNLRLGEVRNFSFGFLDAFETADSMAGLSQLFNQKDMAELMSLLGAAKWVFIAAAVIAIITYIGRWKRADNGAVVSLWGVLKWYIIPIAIFVIAANLYLYDLQNGNEFGKLVSGLTDVRLTLLPSAKCLLSMLAPLVGHSIAKPFFRSRN